VLLFLPLVVAVVPLTIATSARRRNDDSGRVLVVVVVVALLLHGSEFGAVGCVIAVFLLQSVEYRIYGIDDGILAVASKKARQN
jgi:hypothetical protein